MDINLENFNVRKTNPYDAGIIGLPDGVERYVAKAMGLTGIEFFKGDHISIKNVEGSQKAEVVVFDSAGKSSPESIGSKSNGDAVFAKEVLSNKSEKDYLLSKLKKKNIDFHKAHWNYIIFLSSFPNCIPHCRSIFWMTINFISKFSRISSSTYHAGRTMKVN